jgi:hypothetical protein
MAGRTLSHERRERMRVALLLLVVSGVIRPANVEPRYVGAQGTVAVPPSEADHVIRGACGMRIANSARQVHEKENFAMEVTMPDLSEQNCLAHEMDPRRDARKVVRLRMSVADKVGFADGEVTNISPGGCGLRLT